MKIQEKQWVKSNGEIYQERELEVDDWINYINIYIMNRGCTFITPTFSNRIDFKKLNITHEYLYAEYTPLHNVGTICHESRVVI